LALFEEAKCGRAEIALIAGALDEVLPVNVICLPAVASTRDVVDGSGESDSQWRGTKRIVTIQAENVTEERTMLWSDP